MVIGRETNSVELDDAVDLAKKRSDFFVFTAKHARIANFHRRTPSRSDSWRLTQDLHDTLLKSDLVVSKDGAHVSKIQELDWWVSDSERCLDQHHNQRSWGAEKDCLEWY